MLNVDHLALHRNGHGDAQHGNEEYPGEGDAQRHVLPRQQEQGGHGGGERASRGVARGAGGGLHARVFQNGHGGFGDAQAHEGVPQGKGDDARRQGHPEGPSHLKVGVQVGKGEDGAEEHSYDDGSPGKLLHSVSGAQVDTVIPLLFDFIRRALEAVQGQRLFQAGERSGGRLGFRRCHTGRNIACAGAVEKPYLPFPFLRNAPRLGLACPWSPWFNERHEPIFYG